MIALVSEIAWWRKLRAWVGHKGMGFSIAYMILLSPRILFRSFLIAAMITVVLDIIIRIVARPLVGRWYRPRISDDPMGSTLAFRMEAHESVLDRLPARMAVGRRTSTGALLRTNRRVAFAPDAWDVEPWTLTASDLQEVTTVPTPSSWRKLIRGIPDRVVFRARGDLGRSFLVADPREVLAWYSAEIRQELETYEPSAVELF